MTVLLILLTVLLVLALPAWPHSREFGYRPVAILAVLVLVLAVLVLTGTIHAQPVLVGQNIEGASGAVVVPEAPTVVPVQVEQTRWWSPLVGPFVGMLVALMGLITLKLWQMAKALLATSKVVTEMQAGTVERGKERVVEQAALKTTLENVTAATADTARAVEVVKIQGNSTRGDLLRLNVQMADRLAESGKRSDVAAASLATADLAAHDAGQVEVRAIESTPPPKESP